MTPREWAFTLANATSPAFVEPAMDALAAMLPLLADFPEWAFTPASVIAVCEAPRKQAVPALDEIRSALKGWMGNNRPPTPAIPPPRPRGLSPAQAAHVACCDRALDAGRDPARVLAVLHAASGKPAIAAILADRPGLVPLCRARGWLAEDQPLTADQRRTIAAELRDLATSLSAQHRTRKSDTAASNASQPQRIPARLDTLNVARAATPAVLASRPDLRAALEAERAMADVRQ